MQGGNVAVSRAPSFRFAITTWGTALLKCRFGMGLSYKEVADRVGVSKGLVKAWERGTGYPTTATQLKRLYGSMHALRAFENLLPRDTQIVVKEERDNGQAPLPPEEVPTPPPQEIDDPRTFPEALRVIRVVEGFTQEEVGELVGVDEASVSAWECGRNLPVQENYNRLVELFDALREYPRPPGVRAIPKPIGPTGWALGVAPPRGPSTPPAPLTLPPDPRPGLPSSSEPSADSPPRAAFVAQAPTGMSVDQAGVAYARALAGVWEAKDKIAEAELLLGEAHKLLAQRQEELAVAEKALHEAVHR